MEVKQRLLFIVFILFLIFPFFAEVVDTAKMTDVQAAVKELAASHGPENVLVVFDIDNTLLAMRQPLGSDQWFKWRNGLFGKDDGTECNDLDSLLRWQGYCYSIGHMLPPECAIPVIFKNLQNSGHKILLLTSRGFLYNYCTIRELLRNGMDSGASAIGDLVHESELWPYQKADGSIKSIYYQKGIFHTAGLDKGEMLFYILDKYKSTYHPKCIVFVDDDKTKAEVVERKCVANQILVRAFHYTKEDCNTNLFDEENSELKQMVATQMRMLKNAWASGDSNRIQYVERSIFGD